MWEGISPVGWLRDATGIFDHVLKPDIYIIFLVIFELILTSVARIVWRVAALIVYCTLK